MVRVLLFIFFLKSLNLFSFEINKSIDKINIKKFNKYSKDSLPKIDSLPKLLDINITDF